MNKKIFLVLLSFFLVIGCSKKQEEVVEEEIIPEVETVVFQPGDMFRKTFEQTKLSSQEGNEILKELKKYVNINKCRPNDFYEITYSTETYREQTWTNFKYFPEGKHFYSINKSTDNILTSEKLELKTTSQTYEISGFIENSLWESMSALEIKPAVIMGFADVFAWQIDFVTGCRQGDKFKLIYEIKTLEKKSSTLSSTILAAQYFTENLSYTAVRFEDSKGYDGYYDQDGKSVQSAFLKAPLQFKRISSYFTKKRFHPILKRYRAHEGIDYAAPIGTPVSSIGDGVVKKSQYSGGFGNLVIIRHTNGYETYYGHLSKYGKGIKKGARVKQGQIVGYVGSTGLSTGPHLDFRINKNGVFFDFLKMKMPSAKVLKGKDKEDFDIVKAPLLEALNNLH